MSSQDLIDVAREEVESFNAGDWERFKATYAADAVYDELATQRHVEGSDEILEVNRQWKEAFPDAKGTITSASAGDDTVTLEITWEGTQSGPMAGPQGEIPPSNRRAVVKAAQVLKFSDHQIKENHHYFDLMGMLQQLGQAG
jgi:steroid delta-isomerase-like uncharacterized protein